MGYNNNNNNKRILGSVFLSDTLVNGLDQKEGMSPILQEDILSLEVA